MQLDIKPIEPIIETIAPSEPAVVFNKPTLTPPESVNDQETSEAVSVLLDLGLEKNIFQPPHHTSPKKTKQHSKDSTSSNDSVNEFKSITTCLVPTTSDISKIEPSFPLFTERSTDSSKQQQEPLKVQVETDLNKPEKGHSKTSNFTSPTMAVLDQQSNVVFNPNKMDLNAAMSLTLSLSNLNNSGYLPNDNNLQSIVKENNQEASNRNMMGLHLPEEVPIAAVSSISAKTPTEELVKEKQPESVEESRLESVEPKTIAYNPMMTDKRAPVNIYNPGNAVKETPIEAYNQINVGKETPVEVYHPVNVRKQTPLENYNPVNVGSNGPQAMLATPGDQNTSENLTHSNEIQEFGSQSKNVGSNVCNVPQAHEYNRNKNLGRFLHIFL